ncbi:LOW QUALITY PROTEIN: hypothetical protein Dda_0192 [Drechslerella dactyloides]|uniref:Uncharacterized protein n=1 Tax=Drechslerella dactyloides TaxID=74499 RepID=A0AAD6NMV6_DREDA|nr:LOW QUALITY PROTEIN: hypothetical protein Dda_0192 [Drechslerella dactyloides]
MGIHFELSSPVIHDDIVQTLANTIRVGHQLNVPSSTDLRLFSTPASHANKCCPVPFDKGVKEASVLLIATSPLYDRAPRYRILAYHHPTSIQFVTMTSQIFDNDSSSTVPMQSSPPPRTVLLTLDATTPSPNHTSSKLLFKVCNLAEVFEQITTGLRMMDCISLTSSCKFFHERKPWIWNINKHMHHFLRDTCAFRSLMAKHGALVSGSDALQFFTRHRYPKSDLDVYVHGDEALQQFADHLVSVENYTFHRYPRQFEDYRDSILYRKDILQAQKEDVRDAKTAPQRKQMKELAAYEMKSIEGVFLFERGKAGDKFHRQIQIIASIGPPLYAILNDFYTTLIFNFYDYKTAFSIFPNETFLKRKSWITQPLTSRIMDCGLKYEQRGWTVDDYPGASHETGAPLVQIGSVRRTRRVGDKHSWVISLDTTGVEIPDPPPDSIENSTFGMGCETTYPDMWGDMQDYHSPFLRVQCTPYCNAYLQQPLVVAPSWKESLDAMFAKIEKSGELDQGGQMDWMRQLPIWWEAHVIMDAKLAAVEEKLRLREKEAILATENWKLCEVDVQDYKRKLELIRAVAMDQS